MEESAKKVSVALSAFVAAPFTIIALAMDLGTAWRFLWLAALVSVSLPIAWGLTELVVEAFEWQRRHGRKILVSAGIAQVPTWLVSPELAAWTDAGYRAVAILALFLAATAPFSWRFVKDTALARLARELGGRMKIVQAPGKAPRALAPGEERAPEEKTVGAWSKDDDTIPS